VTEVGSELILSEGDSQRYYALHLSHFKDRQGNLMGHLITLRGFTQRKRAEEALQKAHDELEMRVDKRTAELAQTNERLKQEIKERKRTEEKYRLLIENATDAIFIAQDEVLKFANPKAEEMTGYYAEELTKIPFVDLIHPEDRDMVREGHVKRLKGEKIHSVYSFRILNRSGEELSVELDAVLINWEGRPATLNFLRDITAQKKLEAQLQQAQKMEAIGTLAGGIAHDFNNLLMAIQGRTSIMLMNKDSSHPDFGHLMGLEGHIESAADLTKQLLGFARGGKYEVRPTDMNELIKKQNRMFGRTKKEITIRGKYVENLWSVKVDRGQIEQVLLNLYVNAWQAMPGGGDLHLETENATLDETDAKLFFSEPGRYVKISVTDTGTGMDKATRKKIFEPFFTTKEMGRGTGLGLASAYGIVKNHGGFINVYSEKGHGATFNIYLPASEKEVIEEEKPAGNTLKGTETVLFIDDENMIVEMAEELFEQLGYKVLTAGSGTAAIETYEKNKERIDMVLLDMIMPDMNGGETYDKLKEINPNVKVLLASGYSMNGTASEIMDRGCNGFIQKPFKMEELSQKLRGILDMK
jgi:PAS domain S-box-containing protein